MKILAIDPGTTETAFVLVSFEPFKLHNKGKVSNGEFLENLRRLDTSQDSLLWPAVEAGCGGDTHIVYEMIGHYGTGMPAGKEIFETCVMIGRMVEAIITRHFPDPARILRPTVKTQVCGSARAKDGNVRQALIDRFGEVGTKGSPGPLYGVSGDVWAALAVATAWWETNFNGGRRYGFV